MRSPLRAHHPRASSKSMHDGSDSSPWDLLPSGHAALQLSYATAAPICPGAAWGHVARSRHLEDSLSTATSVSHARSLPCQHRLTVESLCVGSIHRDAKSVRSVCFVRARLLFVFWFSNVSYRTAVHATRGGQMLLFILCSAPRFHISSSRNWIRKA